MEEPRIQTSFTEWELKQLIRARLNTAGTLEDAKALAELDYKLGYLYGGVKKLKDHYDATIEKQTRRPPLPGMPRLGTLVNLKLVQPSPEPGDRAKYGTGKELGDVVHDPGNPNSFYS